MKNIEQVNYIVKFEVKGEPLFIPFGSYNDYTLIAGRELEGFIIYLIRNCVNAKSFMNDDENALFVKNVHLYKGDDRCKIYSIERSVQIYPII